MFYSTSRSLVVLNLFGPKVVFACSSIHMIIQQQLILRLREEVHEIHEWPLLKSMAYVQCAPQKILEQTVIYIITMVKYCCSEKLIHQSHMNALETQNWSVCGFSLHPPTSWNGKQHWDATEVLQEATLKKSIFNMSLSFILRLIPLPSSGGSFLQILLFFSSLTLQ